MMNKTLWNRYFADARGLILGCAAVLFAFHWLFVWIVSFFKPEKLIDALKEGGLPQWALNMVPIHINDMAHYSGMLSLAYADPVVLFTLTIFAISRGSDIVSGQLDRGTMEMTLAQPVRRITLFSMHAGVTVIGGVVLAVSCWLGTWIGLSLVELPVPVAAARFIPAALNLLAFIFFLTGLTSMVSSMQRYRFQTISWVGGFFIVQLIVKILSRADESLHWLTYATFFGAYEPASLASQQQGVLALSLRYDGFFLAMGIAAYAVAATVFCRRDLPAPL